MNMFDIIGLVISGTWVNNGEHIVTYITCPVEVVEKSRPLEIWAEG